MKIILWANATALGIAFIVLALIAEYGVKAASAIEEWLRPIIEIHKVHDITRDKVRSCFALDVTKMHPGTPVKYEFFVETRFSARIPVSAYVVDKTRQRDDDFVNHAPMTSWQRDYCFELPGTVADAQDMHVYGEAFHDAHPFYLSRSKVPAFTVPALVHASKFGTTAPSPP